MLRKELLKSKNLKIAKKELEVGRVRPLSARATSDRSLSRGSGAPGGGHAGRVSVSRLRPAGGSDLGMRPQSARQPRHHRSASSSISSIGDLSTSFGGFDNDFDAELSRSASAMDTGTGHRAVGGVHVDSRAAGARSGSHSVDLLTTFTPGRSVASHGYHVAADADEDQPFRRRRPVSTRSAAYDGSHDGQMDSSADHHGVEDRADGDADIAVDDEETGDQAPTGVDLQTFAADWATTLRAAPNDQPLPRTSEEAPGASSAPIRLAAKAAAEPAPKKDSPGARQTAAAAAADPVAPHQFSNVTENMMKTIAHLSAFLESCSQRLDDVAAENERLRSSNERLSELAQSLQNRVSVLEDQLSNDMSRRVSTTEQEIKFLREDVRRVQATRSLDHLSALARGLGEPQTGIAERLAGPTSPSSTAAAAASTTTFVGTQDLQEKRWRPQSARLSSAPLVVSAGTSGAAAGSKVHSLGQQQRPLSSRPSVDAPRMLATGGAQVTPFSVLDELERKVRSGGQVRK